VSAPFVSAAGWFCGCLATYPPPPFRRVASDAAASITAPDNNNNSNNNINNNNNNSSSSSSSNSSGTATATSTARTAADPPDCRANRVYCTHQEAFIGHDGTSVSGFIRVQHSFCLEQPGAEKATSG
jgi:hypothetical protein